GGFELTAVAAVSGLSAAVAVQVIGSLVDKSLVHIGDAAGDVVRYRLLETVRLYAREKLVDAGEAAAAQDAHAAWCVEWAEQSDALTSANAARLANEADNIRAALEWSAEAGRPVTVARLAVATGPMWMFQM